MPADHGAGTPGAGNLPVVASFRLDAQMALDAGDGINYDSCVHLFVVSSKLGAAVAQVRAGLAARDEYQEKVH